MVNEKSAAVEFVSQTMVTFAVSVIAVSFVGWHVGDVTKGMNGLLSLGRGGLSYSSLLQLFIFAMLVAVIKVMTFSDIFIKKMLLLWRMVAMFTLSFISAVGVAVFFEWFPIGIRKSWISFLVSATLCFIISILVLIIRIKIEDKKYGELLSAYKKERVETDNKEK